MEQRISAVKDINTMVGNINGVLFPMGTYYYVIDLGNNFNKKTGLVLL
ncbi:hypothetical protein ADIARSV_1401 [Arcticibacter svalbardensis MN12-7]|uniref:Uncharacterized protein n=1 Tax=Arcticibacter svalbardensis MN12-7 TaxID=1150600 RepID=R9GV46_9SPHI|nr:hypothetical protein [Arcticibacter svalbardensis]EOR95400.1 hypothetical protein ADIARSV_1401 [Arcticibacter svalbardensis MN12-7]